MTWKSDNNTLGQEKQRGKNGENRSTVFIFIRTTTTVYNIIKVVLSRVSCNWTSNCKFKLEYLLDESTMPSVILATAGYDHTIRLWEVPTGYCYRTLQFAESVSKIKFFFTTPINSY